MSKNIRNGFLFPDSFYQKYTNFNSQKDMQKKLKEKSIILKISKNGYSLNHFEPKETKLNLDPYKVADEFIAENSVFANLKELMNTGECKFNFVPSDPIVAFPGQTFDKDYQIYCTFCKKNKIIKSRRNCC